VSCISWQQLLKELTAKSSSTWHIGQLPIAIFSEASELVSMVPELLGAFPYALAVTLEHAEDAPEEDLMRSLECLRKAVS
jgi:hypothetical protein